MRTVEWSKRAKNEFDKTYEFWTINNGSNAYSEKILEKVLFKIRLIIDNCFIGEVILKHNRRDLILENFSLV